MYGNNKDLLPKECHIAHTASVHNSKRLVDGGREARMVQDEMRQRLAAEIVCKKIDKQVNEFHTDYRLDLYVFSPSEFWSIVRRLAQEYAYDRPIIDFDGEVL